MTSVTVRARILESSDEVMASAEPGDCAFTGKPGMDGAHGLAFMCPCGCRAFAVIPFTTDPDAGARGWQWDGSLERPTLSPSLHNLVCGWHGFLRDGVFTGC